MSADNDETRRYRIGRATRAFAATWAVLGISALGFALARRWEMSFTEYVAVALTSLLFGYAAITGQSPAWLERLRRKPPEFSR
jgi:hypothetical protein